MSWGSGSEEPVVFTQNATGGLASLPGQPEFHHPPPIIEPEMDCEPAEPDETAVDLDPAELAEPGEGPHNLRTLLVIDPAELAEPREPETDTEADANAERLDSDALSTAEVIDSMGRTQAARVVSESIAEP